MSHQGREPQPHEDDGGGDRCRPPRPKKKKNTTKAVATNTTTRTAATNSSCGSTPDSAGTTMTAASAAAAAAPTPTVVTRIPAEAAAWMSSAFGLDADLCSAPSSWHSMSVKQLREIYDALYEFDAVRNKRRPLRKRATKPILIHEIQRCFYRMDDDDYDYGYDEGTVVDGAVLQALRLGATNHLPQQQQQQKPQPVGSTKEKAAAVAVAGRTPAAPAPIPAAVPPAHRAPAAAPKAKAPPPGSSDPVKAPAAAAARKRPDPPPAPPKQAQQVDRRNAEQSPRSTPSDSFFSPAASTPASLGRSAAPRPGFGQQASSPSPIWFTPAPAPNAGPAPSPFGSHPPGTGLGMGTAPSGPLFGPPAPAAPGELFGSSSSFPSAAPARTAAPAPAAAAPASPNSPRRRGVRGTAPLPKDPPPPSSSFGAPPLFSFPPASQGSNPFQGGASGGSLYSTLSSSPPQAPNAVAPHPPIFGAFGTGGNPPVVFADFVRHGPAAAFGAAPNRTGQAPPAAFQQQSSMASGSVASAGASSARANSSNNPGPADPDGRSTGPTRNGANATAARTNPDTMPQNPKEMALLAELMPLGFRNPAEVLVSIRKLVSAKGEEQVTPDDVLCDVVQTREEAEFARQMDLARLASERDRRTDADVRRKANALALDEKLLTACAADWIESKDMFRESWLLKSSCGDSLLSHITERPTELKRHLVEILKLEKKSRQWYGQELPSYFFDGALAEKLRVIKDGAALEVALKREMVDLRDGLLLLSNQDGNVPLVFLEAKEEWKRRYGGDDDGSDDDVILLETRRPGDSPQRVETIETS